MRFITVIAALVVAAMMPSLAAAVGASIVQCDASAPAVMPAPGGPGIPPAQFVPGDSIDVPGSFNPEAHAQCTFFFQDVGFAMSEGVVAPDGSFVVCTVPRAYLAKKDLPIDVCSTIRVSVRTWLDDDVSITENPADAQCSSDMNASPLSWGSRMDVTFFEFRMVLDPGTNCDDGSVPAMTCAPPALDDVPAMPVRTGEMVMTDAAPGSAFGEYADCMWYSTQYSSDGGATVGDFFAVTAGFVVEFNKVACIAPEQPPEENGYVCGNFVYLVIKSWVPGNNPADMLCMSNYGSTIPSAGTSDGAASGVPPDWARAFMFSSCSAGVGCVSPPQIAGAVPTVGLNPGDTVRVESTGLPGSPTFSNDNARCLWWYNGNAYVLYDPPVSFTDEWIECQVPDRFITFGPDAGSTIPPCGVVSVTVQAWDNSVTNPQDNQCFSHEGQTQPNWAPSDHVEVEYSCAGDDGTNSDCLWGPFGMTWYNGDIIVANEGSGGGGPSLSLVNGPSSANPGLITTPWLSGFNGPSGLAWLNQPFELLITDDENGGRITHYDVSSTTFDHAFGVGVGSSPLPGDNPNAVRVNAAGDAVIAFAAGHIAKYTAAGTYCELALNVNTPQAVEINDFEGVVYFTDSNINLMSVPMACGVPVDCSNVADCGAVPVGTTIHGGGAHTEGGLIQTGDVFYMSAYGQDAVYRYDRSTSTFDVCANGIPQARGLLVDPTGDWLYVTSYNTDSIWRVRTDCTTLEEFAEDVCEELPESDNDSGACIPEDLFYYKGLVLTKACGAGCDASRPALEFKQPDGSVDRYYKVDKARNLNAKRCFESGA